MSSNGVVLVYQKDPDVVARKVAEEFILVPVRRRPEDMGAVYCLNSVGARIWELVDGCKTVDDITQTILSEYDVKPSQGLADLLRFLDLLKGIGVIVAVNHVTK